MTNQGVKIQLPPGGQFSAAVDTPTLAEQARRLSLLRSPAARLPDARRALRFAQLFLQAAGAAEIASALAEWADEAFLGHVGDEDPVLEQPGGRQA
jgi:hypothetical protein